MGGRDHHRWESVGPRDIDCTFLYEIRKKSDVEIRLQGSRIAENATEVKAVGKVRFSGIYACIRGSDCCRVARLCAKRQLHAYTEHVLGLFADLPNPSECDCSSIRCRFGLKILEKFSSPALPITPNSGFTIFPLLSFCDEPTGNRSVLGTSTVHFCKKYERSPMSKLDSKGVASQKTPPK